jgi:hypothetical protein
MNLDRETLGEMQWVIENVTRDLRERAHYLARYKKYGDWASFMIADADLLDQSWSRLSRQLRQN